MSYVADLHLHSPYAYATSKALSLDNIAHWARLKGIDLLATADFTHPVWVDELRQKLEPNGDGLYQFADVTFVLGTEVSCVYRQGGRSRRVHLLLFAPDFATVATLNGALSKFGKLGSDGRPTLSLSARDLTELALGIHPKCIVIPAHVWTPWYGMLGSKSGFDQLGECFLDMSPHIHALETGLSSDPAMNWAVPELSGKTIVSFSDAHSLPKLGREVTVFDGEMSYQGLHGALEHNRVAYTVEFYPEEGKYHHDGHRKCGVRQSPWETAENGTSCPVCGRQLTLGVLHRTNSLSSPKPSSVPVPVRDADGFIRSSGNKPAFTRLIPLQEIIADIFDQGVNTKRVQQEYLSLVREFQNELTVLLYTPAADLALVASAELADGIKRARLGDVRLVPGYDGQFGKVSISAVDDVF